MPRMQNTGSWKSMKACLWCGFFLCAVGWQGRPDTSYPSLHTSWPSRHGFNAPYSWSQSEGISTWCVVCTSHSDPCICMLFFWFAMQWRWTIDINCGLLFEFQGKAFFGVLFVGTHGGMPLHHAAKRGLDKTVRVLLDKGGKPVTSP